MKKVFLFKSKIDNSSKFHIFNVVYDKLYRYLICKIIPREIRLHCLAFNLVVFYVSSKIFFCHRLESLAFVLYVLLLCKQLNIFIVCLLFVELLLRVIPRLQSSLLQLSTFFSISILYRVLL